MIGAALAEPARDGTRSAVLPGATIRLRREGGKTAATVHSATGIFTGPDDLLEIELAGLRKDAHGVAS